MSRRPGSTPKRAARPRPSTIPSRILKAELPALVWAHPEATESSPMLVAHDGPEYAEHSSLLTLLAGLPPLRATLIGPVDRNETYSASARYARALADEILPALPAGARSHRPRREPRRARPLPCSPALSGHLRRAVSPVRKLLPPRGVVRAQLPALRADRALRRRHPSQPAGARDPGRARLRDGRGESRGEPGTRGVARHARLRRPLARVPRRAQLGRVARLLPAPPAAACLRE